MKKIILAIIALVYCTAIQAQNYKRVFYKTQTIDAKELLITVDDAVATDAGVKFKLRIKNQTNDYINALRRLPRRKRGSFDIASP